MAAAGLGRLAGGGSRPRKLAGGGGPQGVAGGPSWGWEAAAGLGSVAKMTKMSNHAILWQQKKRTLVHLKDYPVFIL